MYVRHNNMGAQEHTPVPQSPYLQSKLIVFSLESQQTLALLE